MNRTDESRRVAEEPNPLREARAIVFALIALIVSVALHRWAHGSGPTPPGMLAGAGLMLGLGVLLANRRRGLPAIVGVLMVAQIVLHAVFTLSGPSAHTMAPPHSPSAMIGAHVVAGVLTAGWLYAGEVALWRLIRRLTRRVPSLSVLFASVRLPVPAQAPRLTQARLVVDRVVLPVPPWHRSVVRRGPPLPSR